MGSAEVFGEKQKGLLLKSILKGSIFALSITIISICVFAFLLRFVDIDVGMIKPINQAIKIISILIGTFFGLKKVKEMGLISGFLIGAFYTFFSFIIFSVLNGGFRFQASLIYDTLFGAIAGAIAGIVAVNFKSK